jgi:hypothetical protein
MTMTITAQTAPMREVGDRLPPSLTATPEVSVVMPCLNEAACVADCVGQALDTLERHGIAGEVVVCDNGSTDGSAVLAAAAGARVVHERRRGYGSAYLRGLKEARGRYIVMADADGTYDLRLIPDFLEPLRHGYDLVMGARQITGGASPLLHRYVGVPLLTGFLNVVAGGKVNDAHCGMRAFTREAIERMNLSTTGMEFASEMIVKAIRGRMRIAEIAIPYQARVGESKLRTFRDGWRHLRFLLLESPTFLFVVPGLLMMALGILALAVLMPGRLQIGSVSFDFHYMVVAALLSILGWQVLTLGLFAKVISVTQGSCRPDRFISRFIQAFSLEKALAYSLAVAAVGLGLLVWVAVSWVQQGFGFDEGIMLRPALFGMTLLVIGAGSAFSAFFLSALMLERQGHGVPSGEPDYACDFNVQGPLGTLLRP